MFEGYFADTCVDGGPSIVSRVSVAMFFGPFLRNLYALEGIQNFKLWSSINEDGTVDKEKKATWLKVYDAKAKEILPRDEFIGRGSGGANIGNRLKIVSAYL